MAAAQSGQCPFRSLSRKMFEAPGGPRGLGTCQDKSSAKRVLGGGREEEPGLMDRCHHNQSPHPSPQQMTMMLIPMRMCSSASRSSPTQVRLPAWS